MLDWHTETACNAYEHKNARTTLALVLDRLLTDGDVWFATAWEIAHYWHERSLTLEADSV